MYFGAQFSHHVLKGTFGREVHSLCLCTSWPCERCHTFDSPSTRHQWDSADATTKQAREATSKHPHSCKVAIHAVSGRPWPHPSDVPRAVFCQSRDTFAPRQHASSPNNRTDLTAPRQMCLDMFVAHVIRSRDCEWARGVRSAAPIGSRATRNPNGRVFATVGVRSNTY